MGAFVKVASLHKQGTRALHVIQRLQKFLSLDGSEKWLFVRAFVALGYCRTVLLLSGFKRLSAALDHHSEPPLAVPLTSRQREQALIIGRVVAQAASATPWQSLCLSQVLVVQRLLVKRGIPGQFYLGVSKEHGKGPDSPELSAHAWLQCDELIVSGSDGHQQFTVISTFSWGKARDDV